MKNFFAFEARSLALKQAERFIEDTLRDIKLRAKKGNTYIKYDFMGSANMYDSYDFWFNGLFDQNSVYQYVKSYLAKLGYLIMEETVKPSYSGTISLTLSSVKISWE